MNKFYKIAASGVMVGIGALMYYVQMGPRKYNLKHVHSRKHTVDGEEYYEHEYIDTVSHCIYGIMSKDAKADLTGDAHGIDHPIVVALDDNGVDVLPKIAMYNHRMHTCNLKVSWLLKDVLIHDPKANISIVLANGTFDDSPNVLEMRIDLEKKD